MACVNKLLTALLAVLVLPFHFSRFMIPGLFYREEAVAAFKKGETQLGSPRTDESKQPSKLFGLQFAYSIPVIARAALLTNCFAPQDQTTTKERNCLS
jgi:hypothetical protein